MNRNLLIVGLLLFIIFAVAIFAMSGSSMQLALGGKTAELKGQTVKLEIADSQDEREKGLSKRSSLPQDTGMLFLFDKPDRHSFWMKDMVIPIDIIFLKDDKVVTIYSDVQPFVGAKENNVQNLVLYSPDEPANRVLELNAGQAKKYGLKDGDKIKFNL